MSAVRKTDQGEIDGEPAVAPDRGGITVFQGSTSHQPPRQVNSVVPADKAITGVEGSTMAKGKGQTTIRYPLVPKSTSSLRPGQFWAIPLDGGGFGCGRVLSLMIDDQGRLSRRLFVAGLMEWIGSEQPTPVSLAGARVIEPGFAHLRTITETGGQILGLRELALDGNEPGLFLDCGRGGNVLQGGVYQRRATQADERLFPVLPTHGYMVLKLVAEELAKQRRALAMNADGPNQPLHRTAAAESRRVVRGLTRRRDR